jgi:electron transfer flavoprotein alpha subunit
MKILVIAEHDNKTLKPSTLNTITAAKQLGGEINVLIAGNNCQGVAEKAAHISDVSKVLLVNSSAYEHTLAENFTDLIVKLSEGFQYILAPATTFGKNILPRVAALLDVAQVSDVIKIISPDTFVRPIFAGNILATVQSADPIKVLTIRGTAFPIAETSQTSCPVEKCEDVHHSELSTFLKQESAISKRPELTSARVIVSGGRALQSRENFQLIESLADRLNAAIGASRAAVDAGYVPNDYQVGQTGKVVAPDLYIAIGISGAIQHLAGMKDSRVIVAINKDADAPIFQIADYGLIGDLFEIIPQLNAELDKLKSN